MKNTTLCYIEKDGKYLMIHRTGKKNDGSDGKWLGVGGHFEDGESPYDCIIREAREETGLTLLEPKYRGIITFVLGDETEYMHLFTSEDFSGNLKEICDEGNPEKLFEYNMEYYKKLVPYCEEYNIKVFRNSCCSRCL